MEPRNLGVVVRGDDKLESCSCKETSLGLVKGSITCHASSLDKRSSSLLFTFF